MEIDELVRMPTAELVGWLLDEKRKDFDLWLGCGILVSRVYPGEHDLAVALYEAAYREDRERGRRILRGWLERLSSSC